MKLLRVLPLVWAGLLAYAFAQEIWTNQTSPTAQNLWGLCFGGGQFVAVGEGGVILTSPNGTTWTSRSSGTTRWLTAVAYGASAGLYVAVGDAGTVLSSPDAITWTQQTTPAGTPRLNAVDYSWGRFTAIGENKWLVSSDDGRRWIRFGSNWGGPDFNGWLRGLTHYDAGYIVAGQEGVLIRWIFRGSTTTPSQSILGGQGLEGVAAGRGTVVAVGANGAIWRWSDPATRPVAVSSGVSARLGAVAFANNQFIAGSDNGGVITSDDGATWTLRTTPTAQALRAIASSDQSVVAVGTGGTILRSNFADKAPSVISQPADLTEQVGSTVAFFASAAGREPLTYQWLLNGLPMTGQTAPVLSLPAVTLDQAGNYSVQISNANGITTSRAAKLTVTSATLPTGLVDTVFAPAISNGTVGAILPLANGSVIIGGDFSFTRADGTVQTGLARLSATGEFDPTFNVGLGLSSTTGPVQVTALAQQPDGHIVVGGNFSSIAGVARRFLARLDATGAVDANFTATSVTAFPTQVAALADGRILVADGGQFLRWLGSDGTLNQSSASVSPGTSPFNIVRFDVGTDGSIVVAGTNTFPGAFPNGGVARLLPTGAVDSSFKSSLGTMGRSILAARVMDDGSALVAVQGSGSSAIGNIGPTVLWYFDRQGTASALVATGSSLGPGPALLYRDGRLVLSSHFDTGATQTPVRNSLLRYNADGTVDNSFLRGPGLNGEAFAIVPAADGGVYIGGAFTTVASVPQARLAKLRATGTNPNLPRITFLGPRYQEVRSGDPFSIRAEVAGTGPVTLSWRFQDESGLNLNPFFRGSSTKVLAVPAADFRSTGYYSVVADGPAGTTTSEVVYVKAIPAAPPAIAQAVTPPTINLGRSVSFGVTPTDFIGISYQWYFNGTAIPGATDSSFSIGLTTLADAGTYSVVLTNSLGTTRVDWTVRVIDAPVLVNLSTRAMVDSGEATLILGFSTNGGKSVTVRGVGPTLASFGVVGLLADPKLTVYDSAGNIVAQNDNWGDAPGAPSLLQIGFTLPDHSKDAAYDAPASFAGGYTMQVTGVGATRGVALAEIYEQPFSTFAKLTNLSTRAVVGTGENVAIAGFALRGSGSVRLLVRGVGPTLGVFGVSGTLANPVLTVLDSQGSVVATNDDWGVQLDSNTVATVAASVGAFALPIGSKDAALMVNVPAGNYTALVSGVGGTTGIALIEIYEAP